MNFIYSTLLGYVIATSSLNGFLFAKDMYFGANDLVKSLQNQLIDTSLTEQNRMEIEKSLELYKKPTATVLLTTIGAIGGGILGPMFPHQLTKRVLGHETDWKASVSRIKMNQDESIRFSFKSTTENQ